MKEAQEDCVVWKDVDPDVFAAFVQVAYADAYTTDDEALTTQISPDSAILGMDLEAVRETMNQRSGTNRTLPQASMQRYGAFHTACKRFEFVLENRILSSPFPPKTEATQSSAQILLRHARIFIFAERFCIERLRCEAQSNLKELMYAEEGKPLWFGDVMSLVWFCYSQEVPEALRQMVVAYAADHIEYYWPVRRFRLLVCLIDEFERSLDKAVQDRLASVDWQRPPFFNQKAKDH